MQNTQGPDFDAFHDDRDFEGSNGGCQPSFKEELGTASQSALTAEEFDPKLLAYLRELSFSTLSF